MINWLQKNKQAFFLLLPLVLLFFLLRLPNLTLQPIFADEAIYIRWAQVMRAEATLRFLPLTDGKTPLFMWVMIPFFKIFHDPLYAGRILSVFSGLATLLGVFLISLTFFTSKKTAIFATSLIVFTPMIVFFDRMALVDSMLSAFSVWSLYLSLLIVKYPRIDLSIILGYFLGGSILTKPPGFFNLLSLPSVLIIFNWVSQKRLLRLFRLFLLILISIVTTEMIYNILRLGPGFSNLNSRSEDYIFSPSILFSRPLDPFVPHFHDLQDWLPKMLTVPVLALMMLGLILVFIKKEKITLAIAFWALIPLLIQMALLRTFTARYILFSFPPLLIIAGWFLSEIIEYIKFNKLVLSCLVLLVLLPQALYFDYYLITNPAKAPLPREERKGYLEDWTAGYGFKEIAQYLDSESKKGEVVVGTEGSFGTLPDGLQIYLDKNSRVKIIGGKNAVSEQLREAAKEHSTFFVANRSRYLFVAESLQLIKEFPKVKGTDLPQDAILFFRVFPIKESTSSAKI